MTPFDLINTGRYRNSPFSVPCPHCGSVASYLQEKTASFATYASQVAVDIGGADEDAIQGTVFGICRCNNRECQEFIHFPGSFVTERENHDHEVYFQKFVIHYFFPAVPLIRIPPATPEQVATLLKRSFAPAFVDQGASGNLLRSAIENLLTERQVPRFAIANGRRRRLTLHDRIGMLPQSLQPYRDQLFAIKWIGNAATHNDLNVESLRLAFRIVEDILEGLYGTNEAEMLRAVKRINRRKKP